MENIYLLLKTNVIIFFLFTGKIFHSIPALQVEWRAQPPPPKRGKLEVLMGRTSECELGNINEMSRSGENGQMMARTLLRRVKNPAMKGGSQKENMVLKLERLWRFFFLIKNILYS